MVEPRCIRCLGVFFTGFSSGLDEIRPYVLLSRECVSVCANKHDSTKKIRMTLSMWPWERNEGQEFIESHPAKSARFGWIVDRLEVRNAKTH